MTDSKVSSRYAESLLSAVNEKNILNTVSKDVEIVINAINSSSGLRNLLSSPVVKKQTKQLILDKIFKTNISLDTLSFIKFIVEKGREGLLVSIMSNFLNRVDEQLGLVSVEVTYAFDLGKDQKDTLKKNLEKLLNKKVKFKFFLDKALLGGFIAKAGDTVYDASVKHQLELLRLQFLKGSSSVSAKS